MKPEARPTSMVSFPLMIVGIAFLAIGAWLYIGPAQDPGFAIVAVGIGLVLIGLAGVNSRLTDVIHELRLIRIAAQDRPSNHSSPGGP